MRKKLFNTAASAIALLAAGCLKIHSVNVTTESALMPDQLKMAINAAPPLGTLVDSAVRCGYSVNTPIPIGD